MRWRKSRTKVLWPSSLVLMKKSGWAFRRGARSRQLPKEEREERGAAADPFEQVTVTRQLTRDGLRPPGCRRHDEDRRGFLGGRPGGRAGVQCRKANGSSSRRLRSLLRARRIAARR